MPLTERCVHKLHDNLACYQDKLSDTAVYTDLQGILSRAKKFTKLDVKTLAEELETKIYAAHTKGLEESEAAGSREQEREEGEEGEEGVGENREEKTVETRKEASDDFQTDVLSSARKTLTRSSRRPQRTVGKKRRQGRSLRKAAAGHPRGSGEEEEGEGVMASTRKLKVKPLRFSDDSD